MALRTFNKNKKPMYKENNKNRISLSNITTVEILKYIEIEMKRKEDGRKMEKTTQIFSK